MSSMNSQQSKNGQTSQTTDHDLAVWTDPHRARCHACGSSNLNATTNGYACGANGCNHSGDAPYDMKTEEEPHPWNTNDGPSKKAGQTRVTKVANAISRLPDTANSFTSHDIAQRTDLNTAQLGQFLAVVADPDKAKDPFENFTLRKVHNRGRRNRYQVVPY